MFWELLSCPEKPLLTLEQEYSFFKPAKGLNWMENLRDVLKAPPKTVPLRWKRHSAVSGNY